MSSVFDLSHTIETGMPVYPGTPAPRIDMVYTHDSYGFQEHELNMTTHIGTHIDAPLHILDNGKSLVQFSLDKFFGTAIKVNLPSKDHDIVKQVSEKIKQYGNPEFILIHTGWSKYWGTDTYFKDFPLPSEEAFRYLADLELKGIGIDTVSIDPVSADKLKNHKIILNKEAIIIENLTNLDKLPDGLFRFFCFPLKINNGDGSPVRAVAQCINKNE